MTRYEFFRKRIAPALFLGLVALIAYDTCNKQERTHATVVLDLGAAEPRVRSVDAELVVDNESIAAFHRRALDGKRIGPCRFEIRMGGKTGDLRIAVDVDGNVKQLTRRVHAEDDATVTVLLGPDLDPAPRP